jgi:trafficking protein particle complex subunit 9
MVVLRDILMSSIRATDPLSSWSAAARLLRSFYPLITPAGQSGLASSLANSAGKLPTGTRCADPCLPGFYQVCLSSSLLSYCYI